MALKSIGDFPFLTKKGGGSLEFRLRFRVSALGIPRYQMVSI